MVVRKKRPLSIILQYNEARALPFLLSLQESTVLLQSWNSSEIQGEQDQMEDGTVWKIATEAARELSQFASTTCLRFIKRLVEPASRVMR